MFVELPVYFAQLTFFTFPSFKCCTPPCEGINTTETEMIGDFIQKTLFLGYTQNSTYLYLTEFLSTAASEDARFVAVHVIT